MSSITSYLTTLFRKPTSHFRNWLIVLVAPFAEWEDEVHGRDMVDEWIAAASTIQDTASEEAIRSVVGTLMRITNISSLRRHIPKEIWAWIKKWKSLPLVDWGRSYTTSPDTVLYIRGRGDSEIFKLYLLAWLVWYFPSADDLSEVENLITIDFNGIGMWGHRKDFLDLLDRVPREMVVGRENEVLNRYRRLRQVLLDMDMQAEDELACKPLKLFLGKELLISARRSGVSYRVPMCSAPPVSVTIWGGLSCCFGPILSPHLYLYHNSSHSSTPLLPFLYHSQGFGEGYRYGFPLR